jgi:hypothetical protein
MLLSTRRDSRRERRLSLGKAVGLSDLHINCQSLAVIHQHVALELGGLLVGLAIELGFWINRGHVRLVRALLTIPGYEALPAMSWSDRA